MPKTDVLFTLKGKGCAIKFPAGIPVRFIFTYEICCDNCDKTVRSVNDVFERTTVYFRHRAYTSLKSWLEGDTPFRDEPIVGISGPKGATIRFIFHPEHVLEED